jgi:hypothetical protein
VVDSLKALDPEWPIREEKRLTLNGRLEKRTLLGAVGTAERCHKRSCPLSPGGAVDVA